MNELVGVEPAFRRNMQQVDSIGRLLLERMGTRLATGTVGDMLHMLNRPDAIEPNHSIYIGYLAPIVKDDNHAGADMVAEWYRRNLQIFANLTRIAEPNDRILVVYGQGHVKILRDFTGQHPEFCIIDPLPYPR